MANASGIAHNMAAAPKKNCEIWAIGGGKGGIGKSFVISCLGNFLAARGKKVVLIDADLGGANLHTFLGIQKPKASLTDFFDRKTPLTKLVVETSIPNLGLLTGTIGSLEPDNIKHVQKLKFFHHIRKIDADYILIDLGAGANFNTIDTFLLADKLIVVTVPEITAIENMYFFLKNTFYRKLTSAFNEHGMKNELKNAWQKRKKHNISNFLQFIEYLRGLSNKTEHIITKELSSFTIHLILNQLKNNKDIVIGHSAKSICKKYYGLSANYVGYIEYDDIISRCINQRHPFMQAYPASRCAREIERIAENLLEGKQMAF